MIELNKSPSFIQIKLNKIRGVAQLASAPALGAGCRGFESLHSDQRQVAPLSGYVAVSIAISHDGEVRILTVLPTKNADLNVLLRSNQRKSNICHRR